jgi:hypothetical protein
MPTRALILFTCISRSASTSSHAHHGANSSPVPLAKGFVHTTCHHDLNQVARMFLATAGALCSRSGLGSGEHVAVCHQQDQARRRAEHVQIVRSSPQYHSRKRSPGFDRALRSDVRVGMQVSNFRGVTFDRALVSDTNKQSITHFNIHKLHYTNKHHIVLIALITCSRPPTVIPRYCDSSNPAYDFPPCVAPCTVVTRLTGHRESRTCPVPLNSSHLCQEQGLAHVWCRCELCGIYLTVCQSSATELMMRFSAYSSHRSIE